MCCLLVFTICSHRFHLAPCHFSLLAWVFPFAEATFPVTGRIQHRGLEGFTLTFSSPTAAIDAQHVSDWQKPNAGFLVQTHRALSSRARNGSAGVTNLGITFKSQGKAWHLQVLNPHRMPSPAVGMPSGVQVFASGFPAQQYT